MNLDFSENMAVAIERMRKIEPDARMKARKMINTILDNFESLCDKDHYQVEDEDGKPTGETDITKYVNATTKIAQVLPDMISKLEEGFGVSYRGEDEDEHGVGFSPDWHRGQSEQ